MHTEPQILFENPDILVVNKPPGMVTNTAASADGLTLQDWFSQYLSGPFPDGWHSQLPDGFSTEYGTPEEIFAQRRGMVHRLDKDTSGVMVFAKHPGSLVNLLVQFRQHTVQKEYLALTHGKFRVEQGTLNIPLGRSRSDRQKFAPDIEGRAAVTQYSVEQVFTGFNWQKLEEKAGEAAQKIRKNERLYEQGFSLVRCLPKTGRTHQIRVHLAHERHPIVGDGKYVGRKRAKIDPLWCTRQFLHAAVIQFSDTKSRKPLRFEASLPGDLQEALSILQAV